MYISNFEGPSQYSVEKADKWNKNENRDTAKPDKHEIIQNNINPNNGKNQNIRNS